MSPTVPPSIKVVQGVAAHEGIDPTALEPPLHAVIDTDALDALFRPDENADEATAAVEFTYRGNHVHVDSAGCVDVTADDADRSDSIGTDPRR